MSESQPDITARFFRWIEAAGITRSAAAAALGVDERSLSTYRSRGLPRRKHARAEHLMAEHLAQTQHHTLATAENRINVPFTDAEMDQITRAAAHVQEPDIRTFIRKAAIIRAQEDLSAASGLKVAEDPVTYRVTRRSKP